MFEFKKYTFLASIPKLFYHNDTVSFVSYCQLWVVDLFIYERQFWREGETEKTIFHTLVYSSDGCRGLSWARPKLESVVEQLVLEPVAIISWFS